MRCVAPATVPAARLHALGYMCRSTSFCSSLHNRWDLLLCVLFQVARFLFVRATPRGFVFWCTAMYHESLLTIGMPPGILATLQSYMGHASASQVVALLQWRPCTMHKLLHVLRCPQLLTCFPPRQELVPSGPAYCCSFSLQFCSGPAKEIDTYGWR